jgi:hypothetical protein
MTCDPDAAGEGNFSHRLYTPTWITKLNGLYFIVDCWHHRIIYSDAVDRPIGEWKTLDDDLAGPHSIVSDGGIYVAEDTGRHRLRVYVRDDSGFKLRQIVAGVGNRPHRIRYESPTESFYVVGSIDQSIHIFKNVDDRLRRLRSKTIEELKGQYTRSITIRDGKLYFVGNDDIVICEVSEEDVKFLSRMPLAAGYRGSNDLYFLPDGTGLFASTPQKLYFFMRLEELSAGNAVDVSRIVRGTPYYIDEFDGSLWIPEITEYSRIVRYAIKGSAVNFADKSVQFDFGKPTPASERRFAALPQ